MSTKPNLPDDFYDGAKRAETEFQKCPACGANMVFDPEKQTLSCEFCGHYIDFEKDGDVCEQDIVSAFKIAEKWKETSVVYCSNCGAKFVVSENEVATACPYCGTSHVRKSEDLAGIKPNALYPFMFSDKIAEKIAKRWAQRRLFAPKRFKKSVEAKNIYGVYEPCFTFDSQTVSTYSGKLGKRRTRTVRTRNGSRVETYIDWFFVSGTITQFFDDVTIAASDEFSQKSYEKLKPFDLNTIKVYSKDYLQGFTAKHYDKDLTSCWRDAKDVMDEKIRARIIKNYDCDEVSYLNVKTIHNDVTFKYVLLPLYRLYYRYKKKNYNVTVNGNTGKVHGKAPVSWVRVLIAVGLGVLAVSALIFGLYCLDSAQYASLNSILLL